MGKIFYTADSHYNHFNIIEYCKRPFTTAEEMNETLIARWNEVVTPDDEVRHLGDFGFGSMSSLMNIRERLNGRIYLIDKVLLPAEPVNETNLQLHSTFERAVTEAQ